MRKLSVLLVLLMAVAAVGQAVHPVSAGQVQKAKLALRVLDNSFDSFSATKWGDDLFDPFTVGLLRGVEDSLEDDRASHTLSTGDDGLNCMVRYEYQYFLHVTDMWSYRARIEAGHDYEAINAMSKRASARYSACHAEIGKTMQRGWTDNGACTFSDSMSDVMDRETKAAEAAMRRTAMDQRPAHD